LSTRGARQVRQIIDLEVPLLESEQAEGRVAPFVRHPEHYSVCIFGDPSSRAPWAWHVGGHHVGLHFTVVDGDRIASVPLFFGANPAEVRHGPTAGQRTLPEEEDLARMLLRSLPPDQKRIALISPTAFPDILTDCYRVANAFAPPRGLAWSRMDGEHRQQLARLVRHYVERNNAELSSAYWRKVEAELEATTFAWAGGEQHGQGHYYAIKAPSYLIEYDNTQNEANHIHSVVRDISGDWGEDLLASHYAESHRAPATRASSSSSTSNSCRATSTTSTASSAASASTPCYFWVCCTTCATPSTRWRRSPVSWASVWCSSRWSAAAGMWPSLPPTIRSA